MHAMKGMWELGAHDTGYGAASAVVAANIWRAKPPVESCLRCTHAWPQAPVDAFYQTAEVAWDYLSPGTKQVVRQTSARGRTLFDSRLTDLVVRLGHRKPDPLDLRFPTGDGDWDSSNVAVAAPPPTPAELRSTLSAILRRGARLRVLRLRFFKDEAGHRPVHEREGQL